MQECSTVAEYTTECLTVRCRPIYTVLFCLSQSASQSTNQPIDQNILSPRPHVVNKRRKMATENQGHAEYSNTQIRN